VSREILGYDHRRVLLLVRVNSDYEITDWDLLALLSGAILHLMAPPT
jgi:hypothetical protein